MIDGVAAKAFSAQTLTPFGKPLESFTESIIENSRTKYGTSKHIVEEKIANEWKSQAEAVEDKAQRRGEQSLSRTLNAAPIDEKEKEKRREEKRKTLNIDIVDLRQAIEKSLQNAVVKGEEEIVKNAVESSEETAVETAVETEEEIKEEIKESGHEEIKENENGD